MMIVDSRFPSPSALADVAARASRRVVGRRNSGVSWGRPFDVIYGANRRIVSSVLSELDPDLQGVNYGVESLIYDDSSWAFIFALVPQSPGYDFLRDFSNNKSFGTSDEKTIRNALLALNTNECVDAFNAAGLTDPFTLISGPGGGIVIGPASLTTNPKNLTYMGIPEKARQEILAEFGSSDAQGFTVQRETSDGRPRIVLNTSAFRDGLGGLVTVMTHEMIHAAGVKGVLPPWYKPWQDDLSFDSKYQKIINTCRNAAQNFIDARK